MAGLFSHIKRAFTWHWNLLAVGGATVFGLLSGRPDVILPAVAAIELGYLGFVGTNRSFQRYLSAKEIADGEEAAGLRRVNDILEFISEDDRMRYHALRQRCQDIAHLRKKIDSGGGDRLLEEERKTSTEQLLWIFLRLLHRKNGVERLLDSTDVNQLEQALQKTTQKIRRAKEGERSSRLLTSLNQKRETLLARLSNYRASEENLELINIELDRTELQIGLIVDGSTHESNPEHLSSQVKEIASAVSSGEQIIQDVYGEFYLPEDTPPLLEDGHYDRELERE